MISVKDLAFGRIVSPDLDAQEKFLTDFGMIRVERTKDKLFMRGSDADHHIHVTELGEPGFMGLAFHAHGEEDLDILSSQAEGASPIEEIDEPGGGRRVRLTDPNGLQIEVIWGQKTHEPLEVRENIYNMNGEKYARVGDVKRIEAGPSRVKRSAHCVFITDKFLETNQWFQDNLGFKTTDVILAPETDDALAIFNHIDAPNDDEFVDHHVFLFFQGPKLSFNHLSFEVEDFDDVQTGHYHMKAQGHKHAWGIGRHYLGSQIFDYWRDPWGRIHEHWTDGDMVNNNHKAQDFPAEDGLQNQWGPEFPPDFIEDPSEHAIYGN